VAPRLWNRDERDGAALLVCEWREGVTAARAAAELREREDGGRALLALACDVARAYALLHARGVVHGDVHPGNVLLAEEGGRWRVRGLLDFGDSLCGAREYEFVAPGVLMVQGDGELQRAMLSSYGFRESQLDASLRARLMLLTVLYECSDLRKYALRLSPEAVGYTLEELERAVWAFAPD
jgi:Ser/Thr protein kinase RdoA (MazF antagonist)